MRLLFLSAILLGCAAGCVEPELTTDTAALDVEAIFTEPAAATKHYKDIDDPADTPAAFKADYTNSNNPWVAGCVIEYSERTCNDDASVQKRDECDGATKLKEAITDNSRDCVETAGAHGEYDCDAECKKYRFASGTCETKKVDLCGDTKVAYCACTGGGGETDEPVVVETHDHPVSIPE